uniref:NADP-dependent oxidoreductase domain-containing protein n=1 Tax=Chelonoidis abingdonii TaxID=106734 RepID=A0A8C0G2E6_CHEAB
MELYKDTSMGMNNGHRSPVVRFSIYAPFTGYSRIGSLFQKSKREEAVKVAIEVGHRHLDGAYFCENEKEVGRAIQEKIADGMVKREGNILPRNGKLLWSTFNTPEMVPSALEKSLKSLQFDYIDLYIIHTPLSLKPGTDTWPKDENGKLIFDVVDLRQTWEAMEACKDAGLVKSIGVSNFNIRQLEMILNKPGLKYKPVLNQVECHPYLNQSKLLAFCKSKHILLEAYCALGSQRDKTWVDQSSPVLLEDPVLGAIAKKYNRSPVLVALRYQLQRGVVVLFKTYTRKRIEENFQVKQEGREKRMRCADLDGHRRGLRTFVYLGHPQFPFIDE